MGFVRGQNNSKCCDWAPLTQTKQNQILRVSVTSTARCSGMTRLSLIGHSSLVLLLKELFCGLTVGAGERSGEKITIQATQTVG